ncbi:MAG: polysaccharide deacetylase family protein, partial [Trichlorobacter sp.]|uniref:polysaccharide deacetylase family protein n=1 Tax=Trichlorobacter sp. TaxID=2911007 RepID=UPI00256A2802
MRRRAFLGFTAGAIMCLPWVQLSTFGAAAVAPSNSSLPIYTFDDVPFEPTRMQKLLSILNTNKATAQFYFTGEGILAQPDSVAMAIDAGFSVGWHSMHHDNMRYKNALQLSGDIRAWKEALQSVAPEYEPKLARFPYGSGHSDQYQILKNEGLSLQPCAWGGVQAANWDVDSFDWHPWKAENGFSLKHKIRSACDISSISPVVLMHLTLAKPEFFCKEKRDIDMSHPDCVITESIVL